MPLSQHRSTRPIAVGKVAQVDGRLWQGTCVCRWHGLRHAEQRDADIETAHHVGACGVCVLMGRDYMDTCTCANCERRRILRRRNPLPAIEA